MRTSSAEPLPLVGAVHGAVTLIPELSLREERTLGFVLYMDMYLLTYSLLKRERKWKCAACRVRLSLCNIDCGRGRGCVPGARRRRDRDARDVL